MISIAAIFFRQSIGIFIAFYVAHGTGRWLGMPQAAFWCGGPWLLHLFHRFKRSCSSTVLAHTVWKSHNVVCVAFPRPRGMRILHAGMSIRLNAPRISYWEWHPFSLTSSPSSDELRVAIQVKGDWTDQFYVAASKEPIEIRLDAPELSALQHASQYDEILLIAAGIGMSPYLSLLDEAMHSGSKQKIRVIWCARDAKLFELLGPVSAHTRVSCVLTPIQGRPNWHEVVSQLPHNGRIGVFFCGSQSFRQHVEKACASRSDVDFYPEAFPR